MITKFSNEVSKEIGNLAALCVKLNREDFQIVFHYSGPSNIIHLFYYTSGNISANTRRDIYTGYLAVEFVNDDQRVGCLHELCSIVNEKSRNRYFEQNPEKSIRDYVKEILGGEIG